ncbi:MAG: phytanoyl-CoA dioxygenase family protein [Candidatus Poribacteria bacterium]|nr:phytanoyl-CoA dioxygenase family protein [Candidatus Poribacteria bacterium]
MEPEHTGFSAKQSSFYQTNGYVVLESVFSQEECQRYVEHLEDLSAGRKKLDGFFQQDKYGYRTFNQHLYDPFVLEYLIDARLHQPLKDCFGDEPEAIQTMHFYEGSEHPLHQDQYYLPDCMSAWIAMVDVDEYNGPLVVQPGSHKGRLITKTDVPMTLQPDETYEQQQTNRYFPKVKEVFDENGFDEVKVFVKQGDVVLFDGKLIHGGAPVLKPRTRRHALACHYIPYSSENWDRDWQRISFDGSRRIHYNKM